MSTPLYDNAREQAKDKLLDVRNQSDEPDALVQAITAHGFAMLALAEAVADIGRLLETKFFYGDS